MSTTFHFERKSDPSSVPSLNITVNTPNESDALSMVSNLLVNPWNSNLINHNFSSLGSYISYVTEHCQNDGFFYELRLALYGKNSSKYNNVSVSTNDTPSIYEILVEKF